MRVATSIMVSAAGGMITVAPLGMCTGGSEGEGHQALELVPMQTSQQVLAQPQGWSTSIGSGFAKKRPAARILKR